MEKTELLDKLVASLGEIRDQEEKLKERLEAVAGDILADQKIVRDQRKALEEAIYELAPVIFDETGIRKLAGGNIEVKDSTEVEYDETAVIMFLASQNRAHHYCKISLRPFEAMARAVSKYEPDLPVRIVDGHKAYIASTISLPADGTTPERISALVSEAKAGRNEAAAVKAEENDLLTRLEAAGELFGGNGDKA